MTLAGTRVKNVLYKLAKRWGVPARDCIETGPLVNAIWSTYAFYTVAGGYYWLLDAEEGLIYVLY